jgi:putative addiction module component (TIGR02574 family)
MSVEQKLQIMEAIWTGLRERFENLDLSEAQKDLIEWRRARVRDGRARLLDWDAVKGEIAC